MAEVVQRILQFGARDRKGKVLAGGSKQWRRSATRRDVRTLRADSAA